MLLKNVIKLSKGTLIRNILALSDIINFVLLLFHLNEQGTIASKLVPEHGNISKEYLQEKIHMVPPLY